MPEVEWYENAACAGMGTELFYPERGGSTTVARGCPLAAVQAECLDYALQDEHALRSGVWGGTGPHERREIRRSRSGPRPSRSTRARVAELLDEGCSQAEIARRLGVSRQAVSQHVSHRAS